MSKAQITAIFWIIIIVILLLFVFLPLVSNIIGATNEQRALNDLKEAIEKVCSTTSTNLSLSLYLPKTDSKYVKLHMANGIVEVYRCSNLGSSGCENAEKIKYKGLNCPPNLYFNDCWVEAPKESLQIAVIKNTTTNTISINATTGVYCLW
jgi:hypothetical protein